MDVRVPAPRDLRTDLLDQLQLGCVHVDTPPPGWRLIASRYVSLGLKLLGEGRRRRCDGFKEIPVALLKHMLGELITAAAAPSALGSSQGVFHDLLLFKGFLLSRSPPDSLALAILVPPSSPRKIEYFHFRSL